MSDLAGLHIKLPAPCWCGCNRARIAQGQWQNTPFLCDDCGIEAGRLDEQTQRFIREFIKLIGRPTSPIELRSSDIAPPPGAGVRM